ncbi:MAG: cyclic nucleotide-binding domain-containing protein [Candidatus Brocadiales bacterium]
MKIRNYLQEEGKAKKVHYAANQVIISQDEQAQEMYFIDSGKVKIQRRVPELGRELEIATLGPNDFFGVLGVVMGKHRVADVVAVTDCTLWSMDKASFKEAVGKSPEFALLVVEGLCDRLAKVNERTEETFAQFKEFTTRFEEVSLLWHALIPY